VFGAEEDGSRLESLFEFNSSSSSQSRYAFEGFNKVEFLLDANELTLNG